MINTIAALHCEYAGVSFCANESLASVGGDDHLNDLVEFAVHNFLVLHFCSQLSFAVAVYPAINIEAVRKHLLQLHGHAQLDGVSILGGRRPDRHRQAGGTREQQSQEASGHGGHLFVLLRDIAYLLLIGPVHSSLRSRWLVIVGFAVQARRLVLREGRVTRRAGQSSQPLAISAGMARQSNESQFDLSLASPELICRSLFAM